MLRHRLRAVAVAAAIVLGMFMISDASASTQLATIVPMPSTLSAFTSASESKLTPLQAMAMQKAMFSVLNQTAQLTQRSCDDADCDASGLLSGTTNSATLKAAAFTPSDLNTTAFRTWTGNVDNLVEMFQLAAKAQSAEFIAFTVNITAGSSGAVSLFVGAVAHDKTTGNLLVGLSGGTATGKVTKLTKTVSYQCCHSCWVFDTCCNTCTRTVGVGDTPQQLDAITGNLTLQVIQAMQVRNIAPPAEGVLSPQYPLGLVSYVSAPGQVTSGPMVRYETSSNGGLGNSLINNIKKLEKEWPILKGILKGDANKTVIAREVTDRGFSTIERQFTDGDYRGVQVTELSTFLPLLADAYNMTGQHSEHVMALLAKLIPDQQRGVWNTYSTLYTKNNGTFAMALILAQLSSDGGMVNLLVSHSTTSFTVTPNLVILESCSSELWGLHKSCSTHTMTIPASMTPAEAKWIMTWLEGSAVASLATFLGIDKPAIPSPAISSAPATPNTSNGQALHSAMAKTSDLSFGGIVKALSPIAGSKTSIGRELVNNKGLSYVNEHATLQKIVKLKDEDLPVLANTLPSLLGMAGNSEMTKEFMTQIMLAPTLQSEEWLKLGLLFKESSGGNLQYATVMSSHNATTQTTNWMVFKMEAKFALAPYVYVVTSSHSYLGGLFGSSSFHLKDVPRGLTAADVAELMMFFDLASMMSACESMGVPFKTPKLGN